MDNVIKNKRYDVALATRNFEIELFWKRSLFFWGFIASSFVGYGTAIKTNPLQAVLIACFGFVCSIAWSLVNRGSKYWQENWETIVANIEDDVTGCLFKERGEQQHKGIWLTSRKFSVSKITIALSDFTILIWSALLIYHVLHIINHPLVNSDKTYILSVILLSLIYAIIMAIGGRSTEAKKANIMENDKTCFEKGFWTAIIFIIGGFVFLIQYVTWTNSTNNSFSYMKEILVIISSLSTLIIAIYAYLQYRIYRSSLKNQLFDRRSKIYEGIKQLFGSILNNEEFTLEDRFKYLESVKGNKFLFKEDIQEYVTLVLKNAALLRMYDARKNDIEKDKIYQWFAEESGTIDDKFTTYLNIYK